jgi:hypothetical protein
MGRISTVDLHVNTSSDQWPCVLYNKIFTIVNLNYVRRSFIVQATGAFNIGNFILFYKTSSLNEEVNCTGPSKTLRVPCSKAILLVSLV